MIKLYTKIRDYFFKPARIKHLAEYLNYFNKYNQLIIKTHRKYCEINYDKRVKIYVR